VRIIFEVNISEYETNKTEFVRLFCFASKRIRGFYMRNKYLDAVHFDGFAHHDRDGLPVGDDPIVILSAG
jgi:hypothetical protein